jgi:hypothetical protein
MNTNETLLCIWIGWNIGNLITRRDMMRRIIDSTLLLATAAFLLGIK